MDGCLFTKSPTGFANNIIIKTEITTATIIKISASFGLGDIPLVIPIAVRIESKENTMFIMVICIIAFVRVFDLPFFTSRSS